MFHGPLRWGLTRSYDSSATRERGLLGPGWVTSLEVRLVRGRDGLTLRDVTGVVEGIQREPDGDVEVCRGDRALVFRAADGTLAGIRGVEGTVRRVAEPPDLAFVDDLGRELRIQRSGAADASLVSTAMGHRTSLCRYALRDGLLVGVHDEHGVRETYEYDGDLLVAVHRRGAGSTYFEYDGNDHLARCIRVVAGQGVRATRIVHGGDCVVIEDGMGSRRTLVLGPRASVIRVIEADGHALRLERDARGNLSAEIESSGATWGREHDESDRVRAARAPDGTRHSFEYSQARVVGHGAWTFEYDPNGRLVSAWEPGHSVVVARRAGVIRELRVDGEHAVFQMDRFHGLARLGDIQIVSGPDGRVIRLDAGDEWLERRVSASGVEVIHRCSDGRARRIVRSLDGRLIEVCRGDGRWLFSYDAGDQLRGISSPGREVVIDRDRAGRIVSLAWGPELLLRVERDRAGRPCRLRDNERERVLQLDRHGRLQAMSESFQRTGTPREEPRAPRRERALLVSALRPLTMLESLRVASSIERPDGPRVDLYRACHEGSRWPLAGLLFAATMGADAVAQWGLEDPFQLGEPVSLSGTSDPLPDPVRELRREHPITQLLEIARDLRTLFPRPILGSQDPASV